MLLAFAAVVLLGGTSVVLVVVTTRELAPFWAATLRFSGASLIAFAVARSLRVPMPRGRVLAVSVVYGVLAFHLGFALFYWGTQRVPAGIASVIMGSVPLLTFLLALAQRLERFRVRGLVGAFLAILGIAVISARPPEGSVPILPMLAVLGAAATAAESAIVIRKIRDAHPLSVNAVGMAVGAVLMFATSVFAGEVRQMPESTGVWTAIVVMVVSSPLLFVLFVYVVQRWSASAAAYQFPLFPIVSIVLAAILLDESISVSLLIGAPLVLLGVHVGAIAPDRAPAEAPTGEPRTELGPHEAAEKR